MTDNDILISDLNDISEILNNNGYGGWCVAIQKAVDLLKEQEAKTGQWIYESEFADCWSNICSECGKRFTNAIESFAPYYWNCGAKMKGWLSK